MVDGLEESVGCSWEGKPEPEKGENYVCIASEMAEPVGALFQHRTF